MCGWVVREAWCVSVPAVVRRGKHGVCLVSVGSWREWCAHAVYEVMAPALVCSARSA